MGTVTKMEVEEQPLDWLSKEVNPIGVLKPNMLDKYLKTGFVEFASPFGVHGLVTIGAADFGESVDFLAVMSDNPGRGDFGRFMDAVEPMYDRVRFWDMISPELVMILGKRGYVLETVPDQFTELQQCMTLFYESNKRRHDVVANA